MKIGPLKVRGFTKETLRSYRPGYGPPVGIHDQTKEKQWGYIGLSPDQRGILEVEVFDLVKVVRGDLENVILINLQVVPGRDNLLALTGTARKKLQLQNFKGVDGDDIIGDIVEIFRNDKGLIEIISLDIEGNLDEYKDES
ncbi:hypothetical protein ACFL21_04185 [Patescibacteria group bacterium]